MSKYKVIALSVGAMSNKIFYAGEIVDGSAFPPGHAEILVKEGFLESVSSGSLKHTVTALDVENIPGEGLQEGDHIEIDQNTVLTKDEVDIVKSADLKGKRKSK